MAKRAKKTPVKIGALTRSGALSLMRTYRDKVGATLHDSEPFLEEATGLWLFRATMPWEDG